jgi:hypothetical protein
MLARTPSSNCSPSWALADWFRACWISIGVFVSAYLALGLLALSYWQFTGNIRWVEEYFRRPGALSLVFLAAVELLFCVRVRREYSPAQPMRKAWNLIVISAGCDFAGALFVQILSAQTALNPLSHTAWWSAAEAASLRAYGQVLGGSLRFAFLSAGLFLSLRSYRKSRFLAQLAVIDWVFLAAAGAFVLREAADLIFALQHGKHPSPAEVLGWPTDPLLWLLLAESMLLYRSVSQMGPGWIGRCWKAFSVGVALVALGDIAIWATTYGYLPWPWSSLGWYLWLPAAAAFAMAPAYQLEAVHRAYAVRARAH